MVCEIANKMPFINVSTYDERIYNLADDKWIWKGTLYWSIQCLTNEQISISNRIPPTIRRDEHLK